MSIITCSDPSQILRIKLSDVNKLATFSLYEIYTDNLILVSLNKVNKDIILF